MDKKEKLVKIFKDTMEWCASDSVLQEAVKYSQKHTVFYPADKKINLSGEARYGNTEIRVTKNRSFEAAMLLKDEFPEAHIAVHNFASATNPGGGVKKGSKAQEECLCRISTLYPVLSTDRLWREFYEFHRSRHDVRYTDACVYTPEIIIVKSDTDEPQRLTEEHWCKVDVITCAAPNLRAVPYNMMNPGKGTAVRVSNNELYGIHLVRAEKIISAAIENGADTLVLGAFGCGAFQNKPEIVAAAFRDTIKKLNGRIRLIEFAVYCSPYDERNYEIFRRHLRT